MKEFAIGKNDAGQRLDRFVSKNAPLLPPSLVQKYIRLKRIKVGGKGSKRDYKLSEGDNVQMYVNDEFFEAGGRAAPAPGDSFPQMRQLDIVYEDGNIVLINKEAGVLCHSDGDYDYSSIVSRLQAHARTRGDWDPEAENSFAPALCNRIDRNTSGIVIAAKNAEALRIINEKIKDREIDKYYLAAVHGAPDPPAGTLEGHIFKDSVKNTVYVSRASKPGTKYAATEYRTLKTAGSLALLECRLITGRTHQIRAQLATAGHPLLGDGKYGSERLNKQYGEKVQALCSHKVRFSFSGGAGALEYLAGKTFSVPDPPFAGKWFAP
ncbi:MAG: RluA family pseudouridine synthase [Oscillospiraceae bacterium]|nr:RluA family pseudouridine synthase [Oscillospiraceae bacterium]